MLPVELVVLLGLLCACIPIGLLALRRANRVVAEEIAREAAARKTIPYWEGKKTAAERVIEEADEQIAGLSETDGSRNTVRNHW